MIYRLRGFYFPDVVLNMIKKYFYVATPFGVFVYDWMKNGEGE